ncbi:fimbria/pilus outer membrane usher protein [Acinetobacter pittii]|uniref:fimbria/pilus outer membrane usher protein n=1 Tax=Acinetobacter pittii TaxID=48296 RepID=UPI001CD5A528|nr:fimbria/pilus outer membrane usher protein [Acinetobacter pittii]
MSHRFTAKHSVLFKCLLFSMSTSVPFLSTKILANELPPPPRSIQDLNPLFKMYLDLVINQYSTGLTIPIIVKGDEYFIQQEKLDELQIKIPQEMRNKDVSIGLSDKDVITLGYSGDVKEWVSLNQTPEIEFEYYSATQSLSLNLPSNWLPTQMLGRDVWCDKQSADSSLGLLNNYDFYNFRSYTGDLHSTLFTEQRFFSPWGVLRNTGSYSKIKTKALLQPTDSPSNGYRRYDTTWQYDNQDQISSLLVGDIITGNKTNWGSSVRLGGVQLQRNFNTRPDLITYPLPQFKGQAALPSTVDLLINGQKANSQDIQSGPFVLNNVPFINGKGEAVIVTTDIVGRQVVSSVPFYISNTLLKKNLFDYSLSAGAIREDYGVKNFSYGNFALAADMRYGLFDWITTEGRTELSNNLQLFGLGSVMKLYHWGVLSQSFSHSHADQTSSLPNQSKQGHQLTVGYSYNQNRFGLSVNHTQRSAGYSDLSRQQYSDLVSVNSQETTTANTYFALEKSGTLGVGYIQTKLDKISNKLLNISWAPILPTYMHGATISISATHDLNAKETNAALQLSIPLSLKGSSTTLSSGYNFRPRDDVSFINYSRAIPMEGGIGFDLNKRMYQHSEDLNQARISYRNRYINTDIGFSGADHYNYSFGLSGAVILMQQGVFAANRIGDSFSLIDTQGVSDVPVRYENNPIGHSNKNGYVFVPSVTPYFSAKYSIDPLDLPTNFNVTTVEKRQAARLGSGIVVNFPIKKSLAANVHLVMASGEPVPVASKVHRKYIESSYVGLDGIAYLENLELENQIKVQMPDQRICRANFSIQPEKAKQQLLLIKPVMCVEEIQ